MKSFKIIMTLIILFSFLIKRYKLQETVSDTGNSKDSGGSSEVFRLGATEKFIPPTIEVRKDLPDDGCEIFTPDANLAPVYIQILNEYESVLMPKEDLVFMLSKNMKIYALCPSKFGHDSSTSIIQLTCKNGKLINDKNKEFSATFKCNKNYRTDLYIKNGDTECPQTTYAIGLNISGQIIIYAESCYDLINENIYYIHYKATKPSQFVSSYIPEIFIIDNAFDDVRTWDKTNNRYYNKKSKLEDQASVRSSDPIASKKKRSLQGVSNQFIYKTIQNAILKVYSTAELPIAKRKNDFITSEINRLLKDASMFLHFHEFNLLPTDIYEPFINNPFHNREILQTAFGWDNLIFGNWKYFQKLLKLQSMEENFEVYIGTSHTLNIPVITVDSGCISPLLNTSRPISGNQLNIEVNDLEIIIPKYIWAYVKSEDPAKSFVAIGVNSPYYEYFEDTMLTCNDICDRIDWLEKLEKFRKFNSFGLIVCCPPDDVKYELKGFPIVP